MNSECFCNFKEMWFVNVTILKSLFSLTILVDQPECWHALWDLFSVSFEYKAQKVFVCRWPNAEDHRKVECVRFFSSTLLYLMLVFFFSKIPFSIFSFHI